MPWSEHLSDNTGFWWNEAKGLTEGNVAVILTRNGFHKHTTNLYHTIVNVIGPFNAHIDSFCTYLNKIRCNDKKIVHSIRPGCSCCLD